MTDTTTLPPVWRRLIAIVAAEYRVDPELIRSRSRIREVIPPRQTMMWIGHRVMGRSLNQVGRYLDRDHSTVLHAVREIDAQRATDAGLVARIDRIVAALATEHPLRLAHAMHRVPDMANSPTRAA